MNNHPLPLFLHLCMDDDRHSGYKPKKKMVKKTVTGEGAYRSGTSPRLCVWLSVCVWGSIAKMSQLG